MVCVKLVTKKTYLEYDRDFSFTDVVKLIKIRRRNWSSLAKAQRMEAI